MALVIGAIVHPRIVKKVTQWALPHGITCLAELLVKAEGPLRKGTPCRRFTKGKPEKPIPGVFQVRKTKTRFPSSSLKSMALVI